MWPTSTQKSHIDSLPFSPNSSCRPGPQRRSNTRTAAPNAAAPHAASTSTAFRRTRLRPGPKSPMLPDHQLRKLRGLEVEEVASMRRAAGAGPLVIQGIEMYTKIFGQKTSLQLEGELLSKEEGKGTRMTWLTDTLQPPGMASTAARGRAVSKEG
uniref:Uncharacterized protein n=1 Tax=Oryza barthii TaxID=65489 RepID=A0A0D3FT65_9ORYZ